MSALNCKPGDLAVFVRSDAGNEGKVVTCIRRAYGVRGFGTDPLWLTDGANKDTWGEVTPYAMDECLRPLRDPGDDAQDETLDWLPVPSTTKEAA